MSLVSSPHHIHLCGEEGKEEEEGEEEEEELSINNYN